jgi:molybdopterin-guanine dinucleotide biosynthesis protein A
MIGLILCGGQSSRMGTDKGLITTATTNWAQVAAGKLAVLGLPCYLSVNEAQYAGYAMHFASSKLIRDNNAIAVHGPLQGVLSAHIEFPEEDLFILACDMPLMEVSVLQQLFDSSKKHAAGAFVFTNDDIYEPLCGIYTASGLAHILQLLKDNQLAKHSMKYTLEHLSTCTIALSPEQKQSFRNFNAHADLNGL